MSGDMRRCADVVEVPDVVGMTVDVGCRLAADVGVTLAPPDPDGPPMGALTWPGVWQIMGQEPVAGTSLYRWDSVVVCFRKVAGGGEAGDREPRRPLPNPDAMSAAHILSDGEDE